MDDEVIRTVMEHQVTIFSSLEELVVMVQPAVHMYMFMFIQAVHWARLDKIINLKCLIGSIHCKSTCMKQQNLMILDPVQKFIFFAKYSVVCTVGKFCVAGIKIIAFS